MKNRIDTKMYHVELLPPRQDSVEMEEDLTRFSRRWERVIEAGHCVCVVDNAMGILRFQGTELIEELGLPVEPEGVMIHLNTFHTKENLDEILTKCSEVGIRHLLLVSGDGGERMPRLSPEDVGSGEVDAVTTVELLKYVEREHPGVFNTGVAFNPYEPEDHELDKLERKIQAGARFIVTQPLIERHHLVDRVMEKYGLPLFIGAWMSKKLHKLTDCIGYEIPANARYDPLKNLKELQTRYPECGYSLSLLGFKNQFRLLSDIRLQ